MLRMKPYKWQHGVSIEPSGLITGSREPDIFIFPTSCAVDTELWPAPEFGTTTSPRELAAQPRYLQGSKLSVIGGKLQYLPEKARSSGTLLAKVLGSHRGLQGWLQKRMLEHCVSCN